MRTWHLLVSVTLLALISGCVRSVQPILTDAQVVTDNSVVGDWVSENGKTHLTIQPADENKQYKVLYLDEDNKVGNFVVRLGKVENLLLAEIAPDNSDAKTSEMYQIHLLPLYSFMVVQQTHPEIKISLLDAKWLKKYIAGHSGELQTLRVGEKPDDNIILNIPTADMQKFLIQHMKDEGAMPEPSRLVRAGSPATQPAAPDTPAK